MELSVEYVLIAVFCHFFLYLQLVRVRVILLYHLIGFNRKGNQENGCIVLRFLGRTIFRQTGVKVKSELESESMFSHRSRSRSWSHLKFVDSAALEVNEKDNLRQLRLIISFPSISFGLLVMLSYEELSGPVHIQRSVNETCSKRRTQFA